MVGPTNGAACAEEVIKSPQDKKLYRRLKLANGLSVLLISDPHILDAPEESSDGEYDDDSMGETSDEEDEENEHMEHGRLDHEAGDGDCCGSGPCGPRHEHAPSKKAAAAMAVGVGSFSDPLHIQGLSHFLEHMLFMGSETFPDENEYDAYLTQHGGSANAYTDLEVTNYHFDVNPRSLRGALDRFAPFFLCPLFKADALEREVNAVDNEFVGVLQSDPSRIAQLRCHTADPNHVFAKFSWGNKKSLMELPRAAGVDPREEVMQYYRQQYSAERMSLVVQGGESLDELQGWVAELFGAVAAGRGPRPTFEAAGAPFKGGELYLLPAVREMHEVTATFTLPPLAGEYAAKAEDYVSHLVGHEGAGSLLSALKARGWASGLSAGVGEGGYERSSAAYLFEVSITLTEAGLAAGPGCGLAVVGLLFEYLAMLRQAGPQAWVFEEIKQVADMRFRFAEEEEAAEYVSRVAAEMHLYAPQHALVGPSLYAQWRPDLVSDLLSRMVPANVRLDLQTSDFDALAAALPAGAAAGREPWFDLPYVRRPIDADLLDSWASPQPSPELALPQRNDFIPSDFSLVPLPAAPAASCCASAAGCTAADCSAAGAAAEEDGPAGGPRGARVAVPQLVADEPGLRVWHKVDDVFRLPRTNAYFSLQPTGDAYASPADAAAGALLVKLLEDALCEVAYAADVAGLSYHVWPEGRVGLDIKLEGFSHKLPGLARTLFSTLAALSPTADAFARCHEALARKYRSAHIKTHKHATYLRLYALREHMWHIDDVSAALEALTLPELLAYKRRLLACTHLEALLHGNIARGDALTLAADLREVLGGGADARLGAQERPADRVLRVPKGSSHLYREPAKNPAEENSCVEVYFQCEEDGAAARGAVALAEQLTFEPIFDSLRSKQQLGYSLHSGMRLTHGMTGFCVVLVSGTASPLHVDERIDAFLRGFAATLKKMPAEEWEQNKAALIAQKLQKDTALAEESDRWWDQIFNRRYCFDAREQEVAVIRAMTKKQLLAWYEKHLSPASKQRAKLAVHVVPASRATDLAAKPAKGVQPASKLDTMKKGWQVHMQAQPVLPELVGQ